MQHYPRFLLVLLILCIIGLVIVAPVAAATPNTTQIHVVKYANDGTTILGETTKTYQWLEANLPVQGDGLTHYYHQGPVFKDNADPTVEAALRWNPEEDQNVEENDNGAVKGTNLKDICDLVGGMNAGETVKLKASDGFSKTFAYENVYNYPARQGPMVITWFLNGSGYPDSGYANGMKLVFFADDSTNPFGVHAMGNYDWHESAAPAYWYYYTSGSEQYPTTTGLSVKYISDVLIYSDDAPPAPVAPVAAFSALPLSGNAPLSVQFTDASTGTGPLAYAWDFDNNGVTDSTLPSPSYTYPNAGIYTVNLTVKNSVSSDSEIKSGYISVTTAPVLDTLFDGTITLTTGETFTKVAYNNVSNFVYTVNRTTPLGALDKVATLQGFTYNVTDKRMLTSDQVLLLDDVGKYLNKNPNTWYPYINGVYRDGFGNHANGVNVIELANNDQVNFYYAPSKDPNPVVNATAVVKIKVNIPAPTPAVDTLFDGTVTLTTGETFTKVAYNNVSNFVYTVNRTTPLGALDKVATLQGFTYNVTDKRMPDDQVLLLDDVGKYLNKKPNVWYAYINGVYRDGFGNHANGVNVIELANNDQVNFYYAPSKDPNPVVNATAVVKIKANIQVPGPVVDTLFDGTVTLTPGETFIKQAWNNATGVYTISRTTPLGALDKVATLQGFTYNVTDKRWSYDQALMLDDVSHYLRKSPGYWYAYVNGVYKDSYGNHANGLDVIELNNNDQVNFFYSTGTNLTAQTDAIAAVRIKVNVQAPGPVVDTLFDGTVALTSGEKFTKVAWNNATGVYTINRTTPLGALDKVATLQGFTYNVTDKRWSYDQALMLDDVSHYLRKSPGYWYAYVNGVYKDSYGNHANGLDVIELNNNDQVNFFYSTGTNLTAQTDALAAIKIKVTTGTEPTVPDWILTLNGAKTTTVSKTLFEQGLACPSSGHQVFWTDTDGNKWGGVPLWLLVSMVDDNPDAGSDHFNFNDSIAAQGYSVKVSSGDGWDTTLASKDIARNDSYIVANTLNGQALPRNLTNGKLSWPLHLKGAAVFGGQQVGNITKIELTGLPQPPTEWTLTLQGDVTDTITQSYFMDAIACHHNVTWTDASTGTTWEGVALWDLAGAVDDIEASNHFTFNDTRATKGYTIRVSAADGFNATFASAAVAHNDSYIVAYKMNGAQLTGTSAPLKLVGPATTTNKQRVGGIVKIGLEGLPDQYPAGNWQLKLNGKISDAIPQGEFEDSVLTHNATYADATTGTVYKGIPLWRLMGWVDDRIPHGQNGFNDAAAIAGYKVIVKAGDGYAKEFTSQQIGKSDAFIVANTMNGAPIPADGSHPPYPLRLVGSGATGGNSVGNIVEIQLTDFQTPVEAPKLHILKYGSDGKTVINETYVDYTYMEGKMPVIGDGTTVYKFEGLTLNASNLWDPEETYPGGYKISNAVKGTRVHDLAELVGGMGSGTTITFVASDGFETTLPYSSIYTNPAVQTRQGDAIIAWWGDGQYVPKYPDGMRLFFTPGGDHVYGQWDMHETLPSQYWRYNFQDNIQYPSAAGLSAKYIVTIKVYSAPESDWALELDGRDIGGVNYSVSKPFLEEALACQFGSEHKATYTDSSGRVWEGMPLWFFAGFVDDADQHSANAFNTTLAQNGYNVIITGTDGYSTIIDSRKLIRNSNYLIANSLNGTHINETDTNWPLRLTGANVTGTATIKGVKSIRLVHTIVAPDASFTAAPLTGTAPLSVAFTDTSKGESITTWAYDFGDGSTSSEKNPVHVYSKGGTFSASLTVTNSAGSSTAYTTVTVKPPVPVAAFTATPTAGPAPLVVTFTDTSSDAGSWSWTFGDGTSSTDKNPVHNYTKAGSYTAKLIVTNIAGSSSKELLITVKAPLPVVSLTATPTSGTVPLTVKFTDTSTGGVSRSWAFGDGTTSTEKNPTRKYTKAGVYTATLTVTNSGGSASKQVTITVNAPAIKKPSAQFTQNKYTGKVPLTVQFTDRSLNNPSSYLWQFGDGSTSTEKNPSHIYTRAGIYTPRLTATNSAGSDSSIGLVVVLPKWFF
jgi:PKD repeat protein